MDEIVKSTFTYKGGRIIGSSLIPTNPAKTVFAAFMVSSLSKKWYTIVRLLPCANISATELIPTIKAVIGDVESCGLFVQVLCTDNYPMNVNIFKLFSPSRTSNFKSITILLFDFVHIIKSIRNNWLNQKDTIELSFILILIILLTNTAVFQDVRLLYKDDQHSVAKLAPRLTSKAAVPNLFQPWTPGCEPLL